MPRKEREIPNVRARKGYRHVDGGVVLPAGAVRMKLPKAVLKSMHMDKCPLNPEMSWSTLTHSPADEAGKLIAAELGLRYRLCKRALSFSQVTPTTFTPEDLAAFESRYPGARRSHVNRDLIEDELGSLGLLFLSAFPRYLESVGQVSDEFAWVLESIMTALQRRDPAALEALSRLWEKERRRVPGLLGRALDRLVKRELAIELVINIQDASTHPGTRDYHAAREVLNAIRRKVGEKLRESQTEKGFGTSEYFRRLEAKVGQGSFSIWTLVNEVCKEWKGGATKYRLMLAASKPKKNVILDRVAKANDMKVNAVRTAIARSRRAFPARTDESDRGSNDDRSS